MTFSKTAFLFAILVLFSCGNSDDSPPVEDVPEIPEQTTSQPTKMIVNIDNLRLRASAGEAGEEIAKLNAGSVVYDLGEVSDFTTKIQLRGIWFDEPWLKVRTEQNLEGWVYGGAVNFDVENPTQLSKMIMDKRLQTFFGKELTLNIHRYYAGFNNMKTNNDFLANLRDGNNLRDTLTKILENKINLSDQNNQLPDLFWLENAVPGFVTQLVAEGTLYYLFRDYRQLRQKALKTEGSEDDDFVALNLLVYSADSIEHFFPSWFIQTWDYGGCSLLGKGEHLKILKKIDEVLGKSRMFATEIMEIKNRLINDITGKDVDYWENKENILAEVHAILAAGLNCLTNEDKIALETRRMQFEYPAENNINVNVRAGEVY